MAKFMTGGCFCGAVRYRVEGEPRFSFLCQCRRCQRLTGTGHAPAFMIGKDQLSLTGTVSGYTAVADSGHPVTHSFCPQCGSPISSAPDRMPDICSIYAASLDGPSTFKPERVLYSEFGQPWDLKNPEA